MTDMEDEWVDSGEEGEYPYEPLPSYPSDEDEMHEVREALRIDSVDEIDVHAFCDDPEPRVSLTKAAMSEGMASRAPLFFLHSHCLNLFRTRRADHEGV